MKSRHIALIPAYKPEDKLIEIIDGLREREFSIVVVDDGSGPEFEKIFERAEEKAVVLHHENNKGKGSALKTGLKYIYEYMRYSESGNSDGDSYQVAGKDAVIVTVDADGQHLPEDVARIVEIAGRNKDALVLGSRALAENVPLRSQLGNTITRHVYAAATGVRVHDTQTGLRAFSIGMIPQMLEIEGERYEYEINVLLRLAAEGVPIIEEEIDTIYDDNNSGSHFNTVKDSFRIYREIAKFSASSLISFGIDYAMYALLLGATGAAGIANALSISNIGARIVSSCANFAINKRFVFKSNKSTGRSAAEYFILAALILAGNTVVLNLLVGTIGLNRMAAKLITEAIFFIISWTVQKYLIFYKRQDSSEEKNCSESDAGSMSILTKGGVQL